MSTPIALALRYSEHYAPPEGTIDAHKDVLRATGYVWFGKVGRPVGPLSLGHVADQLAAEKTIDLVLVSPRHGKDCTFHLCSSDMVVTAPPANDDPGIPSYYAGLPSRPRTWFRVQLMGAADSALVERLTIASTGSKLSKTLRRSMSGLYVLNGIR